MSYDTILLFKESDMIYWVYHSCIVDDIDSNCGWIHWYVLYCDYKMIIIKYIWWSG